MAAVVVAVVARRRRCRHTRARARLRCALAFAERVLRHAAARAACAVRAVTAPSALPACSIHAACAVRAACGVRATCAFLVCRRLGGLRLGGLRPHAPRDFLRLRGSRGFAAPPLAFAAALLAGGRRWSLAVAAGGGVRAVRCRPFAVPSAARGVLGVRARFQLALYCELDPKGQVPTNGTALSNLGGSW